MAPGDKKPADQAPPITTNTGPGWPATSPEGVVPFSYTGGETEAPTATGQSATGPSGTATVWNQKAWSSIFPNSSDLATIGAMSDVNSSFWNDWQTKTVANAAFSMLPSDQQAAFNGVARAMGNGRTGRGLYQEYVQQSAVYGADGTAATPYVLLRQEYGDLIAAGGLDGGGSEAYTGPTTASRTDSSVRLTDPMTAKGLLSDTLTRYLGKEPSAEDLSGFVSALNSYEKGNAQVTKSTATTTPDAEVPGRSSDTVQSSMTTGGTDPAQFAEDWARSQEGSAEFQAATEYMDAFLTAIKNPLDVV
jgi:hypothetical protein